MNETVKTANISIVLVEPQIPENIGSVARAMKNMDIKKLVLVNPKNFDPERIMRVSTIHSADIVENIEIHDDLRKAIAPYQYVVGTTARQGAKRPALTNPRSLAEKLVSISRSNRIAVMFGPEDRGLSNDHLRYCHTFTTIPTSNFSSLNLSQAVMVVCYEIFSASTEKKEKNIPRMANIFELEGMYDHLKAILLKIGFLNPQNPEHWMINIRRFLSRQPLRAREVRVIRGICRQIDWYTDQIEKGKEEER